MPYSDTYSDLYDPAFPASTLDTRVELLLGATWTDISAKVLFRDGVSVSYGHPDETSKANPTSAALTLRNGDGRFSPRNPTGAYYGLIGRNTPMRLSTPQGGVYLRMEDDTASYASCPDRPALDITGDIDVRIEIEPTNYAQIALAAKAVTAAAEESWVLELLTDGTARFSWSTDGTVTNVFRVGSSTPIPLGRIALRATLSVSTGTVTFYTAPGISGTWTQLGVASSGTGGTSTSIFASTAPVQIGNVDIANRGYSGAVYAFRLYSGIGGTLVASPDFTAQVPGSAPFADAQGNIWSLTGTAQLSDRRYRAHVEVPAWPPQWDPTGQDVYDQIEGAGLLRRYTQGTPPVESAMARAYVRQTGSSAPVAYWPCEDGSGSSVIASGLPSGAPMAIFGTPQLAGSSVFACSQPIPVVSGSRWAGPVPTGGTWNANIARMLLAVPASLSSETDLEVIASIYTTGTIKRVDLLLGVAGTGSFVVAGYDAGNVRQFITSAIAGGSQPTVGSLMRISFGLFINAGAINWELDWILVGGPGGVSYGLTGATGVSGAVGAVTKIDINPNGTCQQLAIGHVSVQQNDNTIIDLQQPLNAYLAEPAATRFARLCTEQGVNCRIYGIPTDTVPMGYQLPSDFVSLLQDCENTDRGLMFEPKQALAFGYRTRPSMFNQTPKLALSYTAAQLSTPIEPTDDDQLIKNDLTVTRVGGASYRASLTTGALSTLAPPNGVGEYGDATSASLGADTQLPDQTGWLLHMGTVDDLRYPSLSVNLARPELAGALYYAAQDVKVGDRVTVASTPGWLPPDGVSQIVRGGREVCYGFTFTEQWNCAPEAPYRVAVLEDLVLGRGDTDGSTLQGNYAAGAVALLVATTGAATGSPLWTTSAGDFPFDISVGGERMTVTNITGTVSPQTFTVTRAVNGVTKPQTNGTDVRLFQPAILSM